MRVTFSFHGLFSVFLFFFSSSKSFCENVWVFRRIFYQHVCASVNRAKIYNNLNMYKTSNLYICVCTRFVHCERDTVMIFNIQIAANKIFEQLNIHMNTYTMGARTIGSRRGSSATVIKHIIS